MGGCESPCPAVSCVCLCVRVHRASCLCRIFTEMAETFLYHMIHQPNLGLGTLSMLDLLLECVSHPDYEVY